MRWPAMEPERLRAIRIVADSDPLSAFLPALIKKLARETGAHTSIAFVDAPPSPGSLEALLSLERLVVRRGRPCWADRIDRGELYAAEQERRQPELIVDLTSAGVDQDGIRVLRPLFDGAAGESALASALFFRGTPRIDIARRVAGGRYVPILSGTASLEAADGMGGAMEAVWSRMVVLLLKAIRSPLPDAGAQLGDTLPITEISRRDALTRGTKAIAGAAARAAYHLCCRAPHWRIGWRFTDERDDVWSRRDLGGARWNVLPDPISHFYADPVPLRWKGIDHLFFEDLPHRTGKGVISVVRFGPDGRPGPVEPVLEEPWHLSYPNVFERDGEVWMIPEASLSGRITLYRALDFPYRWIPEAVLVDEVEAADATILEHENRFYMFAVVRDGIGGYSDTLAIWHAPSLFGPWTPHEQNPVMVDDRAARPAGNFVRRGGVLYRPVQDCRAGYGTALGLARVDRIDTERYQQTVETVLHPDLHWPGRKLHTLNRSGRLEVVDGSVIRPRFRPFAEIVDRRYRPA